MSSLLATSVPKKPHCTIKQKRFVKEYLKDLNATQAAIRAGYSKHSADVQGCRLLRYAKIKAKLSVLTRKRDQLDDAELDETITETRRLAHSDISAAYDAAGNLLPLDQMPGDLRRCIARIDVVELFEGVGEARRSVGVVKKIRLWDKPRALELEHKRKGLLQETERAPTTTIVVVQKTIINGVAHVSQATQITDGNGVHEPNG